MREKEESLESIAALYIQVCRAARARRSFLVAALGELSGIKLFTRSRIRLFPVAKPGLLSPYTGQCGYDGGPPLIRERSS